MVAAWSSRFEFSSREEGAAPVGRQGEGTRAPES